jgi:5-methylcytosine-specific restriction endonuclease McrA
MSRRKWTDEQLTEVVKTSFSLAGVIRGLGLCLFGQSYVTVKKHIKRLNLDTSHFTGRGHLKGKTHNWSKAISLDQILVKGSGFNTFHLKHKLLKLGLLEYKCTICKLVDWQGKCLSLQLDHVNGDSSDHRFENLRLLCPNCHSQTDTFAGKNKNLVPPTGIEPAHPVG